MSALLETLNSECFVQQFVTLKSLEVGKKYKINSFSKCKTVWGEKVIVQIDDTKTVLPARFNDKLSPQAIEELNKDISTGIKIFLVSRGAIGQTTNIEFVKE